MSPSQPGSAARSADDWEKRAVKAEKRATRWKQRAKSRNKHDWFSLLTLIVAVLPGLAAFGAFYFSQKQIQSTNKQLSIDQNGQITDRYNAAITNLGSGSMEIRLGGIYALQRIMRDSRPDQPTVVAVLCAFVRDQTPPAAAAPTPADVQAALTVVGTRTVARNGRAAVIDLHQSLLRHAQLEYLNLARGNLSGAQLHGANLDYAQLAGVNLSYGQGPRWKGSRRRAGRSRDSRR